MDSEITSILSRFKNLLERERAWGEGARERERISSIHCNEQAEPRQGSIPGPQEHNLSRNQEFDV